MVPEVFKSWFNKRYTVVIGRNGKPSISTSGHKYTVTKVHSEWLSRQPEIDGWEYVSEDDIEEFVEDSAPCNEEDSASGDFTDRQLSTVRGQRASATAFGDYFNESFEFRNIHGHYFLCRKNTVHTAQADFKTCASEVRQNMLRDLVPPPSSEEAVQLITRLFNDLTIESRNEALRDIQYDEDFKENYPDFSFKKWTQQLFSYYGIEDTKINRKMWKYFMHHLKRAAWNRDVEWRYMYLIFSRTQGIGKSRLLRHLCSPFPGGFNDSQNMSMFNDNFSIKAAFAQAPVMFDLQEMGMGKSGGDADFGVTQGAKAFLTGDVYFGRDMMTQTSTGMLTNSVMTSSTNLHVSEVLHDSDYRRFYVFECGADKSNRLRDWGEVDEFFDTTLKIAYRSLNENVPPEMDSESRKSLSEVQESYSRMTNLILQFQEETGLHIVDEFDEEGKQMDLQLLYKKFNTWASAQNIRYSRPRMQSLIALNMDIMSSKGEGGKEVYFVKEAK